jgi:anti-sigma regulatory factor (Ser/Thr protein kinase)
MTPAEARLRIPAELARLADVRRVVREAARDAGASRDCVDDICQAVDEAATNTIVHGYAGRPGWVEVAVSIEGPDIVVTLEDAARTFDPRTHPEPDMAVSALVRGPHGMGVHLMRLATDSVGWRPRDGGGNILTLVRTLAQRPEED